MKKDMTVGCDWKLILIFTLPIMAGNLLQQLYATVDGIIVGNFLGEFALSAVGTCAPLMILFLALALGLGAGSGIMISQYFGARKMAEMRLASSTILLFMAGVGLLMTILGISLSPLILKHLLNVPANNGIADMATLYFRIYSIGLFFQFVYNAIAYMLRSIGDSKATLYFLSVSAVTNVVLDLVFVALFHWGVAGAAAATVISQAGCSAVSYLYMIKRAPDLKPDFGGKIFDRNMCLMALRLGVPTAIQQSIVSLGHISMQRLINAFGSASMSAYAASGMIEQFALIPIRGFNNGIATFAGQNVGAKKLDRARTGMKKTQLMAIICCFIIIAVIYSLTPQLLALFNLRGNALARGVEQLRFIAPWYLLFSIYLIIGGMLQGAGDVFFPMLATICALTTRIVVGYVGVNAGFYTYNAAWAAIPFGWSIALIINTSRYLSGRWTTKGIAKDTQESEARE